MSHTPTILSTITMAQVTGAPRLHRPGQLLPRRPGQQQAGCVARARRPALRVQATSKEEQASAAGPRGLAAPAATGGRAPAAAGRWQAGRYEHLRQRRRKKHLLLPLSLSCDACRSASGAAGWWQTHLTRTRTCPVSLSALPQLYCLAGRLQCCRCSTHQQGGLSGAGRRRRMPLPVATAVHL
jgi:hypothetical protein